VYQATFFLFIKYTEFIRSGPDGNLVICFMAILGNKGVRRNPQEIGDHLYLIPLNRDTALPIATGSAHFAFKRSHSSLPKIFHLVKNFR
jgi:hypothetical protein